MRKLTLHLAGLLFMGLYLLSPAMAAQHHEGTVASDLVPGDPMWQAITPDGHTDESKPLPIIFALHGGGGGETTWPTLTPLIEQAWADGSLPPSVVVMVNVGRGFYMDFKDGSEKWESFYLREFIPFAREKLNGARTADQTVLMGVSMGGMGSLRMAFKNPEMFAAVVALEPALESRTDWDDLTDRDTFYRAGQYERIFGDPIDKAFWQRNHPTWLALTHYKSLRDSGIQIYIEVGDQDMLYLQYGTEALHRALWDNQVPHEYRLVRGADHVGPSLTPRILDALGFAGRALNPPDWNTGKVKRTRAMFKALILRSGNWSFDHKD